MVEAVHEHGGGAGGVVEGQLEQVLHRGVEAALRGEELGELHDLVGDEGVPLLALRGLLEDDELLDEVEQRRGGTAVGGRVVALPQRRHLCDVGRAHVAEGRRGRVTALGLEPLPKLVAEQAELLRARVGVDQAERLLPRGEVALIDELCKVLVHDGGQCLHERRAARLEVLVARRRPQLRPATRSEHEGVGHAPRAQAAGHGRLEVTAQHGAAQRRRVVRGRRGGRRRPGCGGGLLLLSGHRQLGEECGGVVVRGAWCAHGARRGGGGGGCHLGRRLLGEAKEAEQQPPLLARAEHLHEAPLGRVPGRGRARRLGGAEAAQALAALLEGLLELLRAVDHRRVAHHVDRGHRDARRLVEDRELPAEAEGGAARPLEPLGGTHGAGEVALLREEALDGGGGGDGGGVLQRVDGDDAVEGGGGEDGGQPR
mmetsp:Transcript_34885/g.82361  ORF Transcript_34885/g.82361 Transcript_34885/m.82361 type:complete len:428 (-) Transcript_34885:1009-2292(-)